MASNWPFEDEYTDQPEWWAELGLPASRQVGLAVPRYNGQRLGSYRLQNQLRDMLAQQALTQRLFPETSTPVQTSSPVLPVGIANIPGGAGGVGNASQAEPEPPQAPSWWSPAGTPTGDFQRRFAQGNVLQKGLASLEYAGRGLGGLAQGVEGTIGRVLGAVPSAKVQPGGLPEFGPSLNQQMLDEGYKLQQAAGQDYTSKYRSQANIAERPFGADDPVTWAAYQTRNVAYSGPEAQKKALRRTLFGEDPTVVLRGLDMPGEGAFADEVQRFKSASEEYVESQGRLARAQALSQKQPPDPKWGSLENYANAMEQQARENAAQWINSTRRIPGVEEPVREMVGQIALDPLNLPQVNKAQEIILKPVISRLKGTAQAVERVTEVYNDSMKAQVTAVVTGVGPRVQAVGEKIAQTAEKGNPLARILDSAYKRGVNLFTYTPQTQARVLTGTAWRQLGNLASGSESGAQMTQYLTQFLDQPEALAQAFGAVPTSIDAEIARPVIAGAREKLLALPSLQAGAEFNAGTFLAEADAVLYDTAKAIAKVPKKAPTWQRWAQNAKTVMSEFYLKTPGYIARNWFSDNSVATMDGLRMFERMDRVTKDLEQFGVTTRRIAAGTGGLTEEIGGARSIFEKVPGVGKVQSWIGGVADKAEQARYTRAYWSGLMDFVGTNWKPQLSQETVELFHAAGREDVIEALQGGLKGAKSGKEIRQRALNILDANNPAERYYVTQHVGANDLPTDVAATIEADLRRMRSEGATTEQVNKYLDGWKERLQDHTRSRLLDLGPVLNPRATTAQDALLDVEEDVRAMQRSLGRAVQHGDMSQEEAAQFLTQHRQQLEEQARTLAGVRAELAQVLGSAGDNVTDAHMAAVLHAIDGEFDIRNGTRPVVDDIRRKAWQQQPSRAVWEQYRADVARTWGEAGNQTIQRYKQSAGALQEIIAGGDPAAVAQKYGITDISARAEAALTKARQSINPLEIYDPKLYRAPFEGAAGAAVDAQAKELAEQVRQFDSSVADARAAWDAARNESRRRLIQMVKTNPALAPDGFDIFKATERDVQRRWDLYIAKKNELLALKDDGKIDLAEYGRRLGEEARQAFAWSTQAHGEKLIARLEGLEIGRSEIGKRLKGLGYQGDELRRLVAGISDGSTRDEVAVILRDGKRAPAVDVTAAVTPTEPGAKFGAGNPPASAAELLTELDTDSQTIEGLQSALDYARRQRARAEQLTDFGLAAVRKEAAGQLPTKAEAGKWLTSGGELKPGADVAMPDFAERFGATFDDSQPGGALEQFRQWLMQARDARSEAKAAAGAAKGSKAGEDAYAQWVKVEEELQAKLDLAQNVSTEVAAARDFVRQTVAQNGLAQAAEDVRLIASGGTEQDVAMLAELAQMAREKVLATLDVAEDVGKAYEEAEKILSQALFGQIDNIDLSRARDVFRRQAGVPVVAGLEPEMRVETIRKLAEALELNPDEFVRGERTATQVIDAAIATDPTLAQVVAQAETVHADGRIKAEPWNAMKAQFKERLTGDRRKPGEVLKELAGQADEAQRKIATSGEMARQALAQRIANVATFDELKAALPDATVMKSSDPTGVYVYVTDAKNGIRLEARGNSGDEAVAELKRQLRGGAGVATSGDIPASTGRVGNVATSGDELSGEQLAELDANVANHPLMETATYEDQVTAEEQGQLAAIEKIRAGVGGQWDGVLDRATLPKGARLAMEKEIKRLAAEWQELRAAAVAHAGARADFSLLDYGMKRGFDTHLAAIAPFYYWSSRQGRNFAVRFMEHPQSLVNYMRYRDAMQKENSRRGYRKRFEGGWEITLPDGRTSVFIDPLALIVPFADLVRTDWDDSNDSKSALAQLYDAAGSIGLRPGPWIDVPVRMMNLMVSAQPGTPEYDKQVAAYGKGSIGSLVPQAAMLKGATALAGIGGPGGLDVERPVRRLMGISEAQPFEPYTVGRAIRDMAAEQQQALAASGEQFNKLPYILAQAIITAYSQNGWGDMLNSATSGDVAKEMGVSVAEAQQALQIAREAATRAAQQKGISVLASGLLGQRVQVMPEGERLYGQMQEAERGAAYSPYSGTGSRAEVLAVREANPALAVGRAQYGTLPGEETDTREIYQSAQRDEVYKQFDLLKDALIAGRPWDRKAAMAVEDARAEALASLGASEQGSAGDWRSVYAKAMAAISGQRVADVEMPYRARSIAGANPTEAVQIRKDEAMAAVVRTRPRLEDYATSGGIPDYTAYRAALAEWEAALPQIADGNATAQAVIGQAEGEGSGAEVREFLAGLKPDDVAAYFRRNDTPLEAAQRAYYESVYTPAVAQARGTGTRTVEARLPNVGAMDTDELIGLVQEMYPGRWSKEELQAQLNGMQMPSLREVVRSQMSPAARATAERMDQFRAYVAEKWKSRGARALQQYEAASDAAAKAKIRRRYPILSRILEARTEFMRAE